MATYFNKIVSNKTVLDVRETNITLDNENSGKFTYNEEPSTPMTITFLTAELSTGNHWEVFGLSNAGGVININTIGITGQNVLFSGVISYDNGAGTTTFPEDQNIIQDGTSINLRSFDSALIYMKATVVSANGGNIEIRVSIFASQN